MEEWRISVREQARIYKFTWIIMLIEQYEPQNFVQHVIQEYAFQGNLVQQLKL